MGLNCRGGGPGEGGLAASPTFWATQILWVAREVWAKPVFKDVSSFFNR